MHPARLPSSFCLCRLAEDRAFLLQAIPEHPAEGELDWELIARHFGRCVLDWERRWCLRGRCVLDWEPIALHFGRCVLRQLFPGFGRCVLGCNHCPPLERRGTRLASATGRGSGLSQLSRDGKCRHNAHVAKLLLMRLQLWGAAAPPPAGCGYTDTCVLWPALARRYSRGGAAVRQQYYSVVRPAALLMMLGTICTHLV